MFKSHNCLCAELNTHPLEWGEGFLCIQTVCWQRGSRPRMIWWAAPTRMCTPAWPGGRHHLQRAAMKVATPKPRSKRTDWQNKWWTSLRFCAEATGQRIKVYTERSEAKAGHSCGLLNSWVGSHGLGCVCDSWTRQPRTRIPSLCAVFNSGALSGHISSIKPLWLCVSVSPPVITSFGVFPPRAALSCPPPAAFTNAILRILNEPFTDCTVVGILR